MAEQPDQIRRVLPRGRNALDRDSVAASQRARIFEAMCELVVRDGYQSVTVADVVARAGVAKPTFYQHFDSKEGCLLALLDHFEQQLIAAMREVLDPSASTADRIRRGIGAMVEFMAADVDRARLLLIEAAAAGPTGRARIEQVHDMLASFYLAMREESRAVNPDLPQLSEVRVRSIVGAITESVVTALRSGESDDVRALLDDLVESVTLLALGRLPED